MYRNNNQNIKNRRLILIRNLIEQLNVKDGYLINRDYIKKWNLNNKKLKCNKNKIIRI